ncbi:hypothetical protein [Sphingobacterium sp.]|uniref:serine O-acetyltransferase n=1 Tax=Sphingobacterium sp. TaxID=341027 RepID=UPI0028AD85B5|nr:hypothetical protein [Sphingobacterium sp.]
MSIKKLIDVVKKDMQPNASFFTSFFLNRSFKLLFIFRVGQYFHSKEGVFNSLISRYLKNRIIRRGCDISYGASIGERLKLPHPLSIVIGDGALIENDVVIYQNVTIGSHGKKGEINKEYPTIKNCVKIYAGSTIIGSVVIGENSIVGAMSLVNRDIPENSIAYGIPIKIKENF